MLALVALLAVVGLAAAEIVSETLMYPLEDEAGTMAKGYISYDTEWTNSPAVIVVHQWQVMVLMIPLPMMAIHSPIHRICRGLLTNAW